jgi:hypothetical protein
MKAKDTVVGSAKQIVAEIVGDGRLAEEGSREAVANRPLSVPDGLPQNRSKLGKLKMPPSEPRKDKERETREAVVQDADKTEGKDRDLVHGDGGTLGIGDGDDLHKDD